MRLATFAFCMTLAAIRIACAGEFKMPEAQPFVSATMPDDWQPTINSIGLFGSIEKPVPLDVRLKPFDKGDGPQQLSYEMRDQKSFGNDFDRDSEQKQDEQINGMAFTFKRYVGKETTTGKPLVLIFGILDTSRDQNFRVTMLTSPEGETAFMADFLTFVRSIKPL